ncbi:MAG: FHA domain-containing protein [Polyangiaceae bacterium]|nr:FHA domain-containing protein [Polyangiaceae bacterium]
MSYTWGVDDDRKTWPGNVPIVPASSPRRPRDLALLLNGQEIPLRRGEYMLGRAPSCEIIVDDMLVSRAHAKITVTAEAAVIRDLGSINGVCVNGVRIDMPTPLRDHDQVRIGRTDMRVVTVAAGADQTAPDPSAARHPLQPVLINSSPSTPTQEITKPDAPSVVVVKQVASRADNPEKADALVQFARLADRMLLQGRVDDAVRAMSGQMKQLLEAARDGRDVAAETLDLAARYAMTFAEQGAGGRWFDYVVELHLILHRPFRAALIDRIAACLRKNVPCDRELFSRYQSILRKEERDRPVSERVLVARIGSLEPR